MAEPNPTTRFPVYFSDDEKRLMRELRTILERRRSANVPLADVLRVALREMAEREGVATS